MIRSEQGARFRCGEERWRLAGFRVWMRQKGPRGFQLLNWHMDGGCPQHLCTHSHHRRVHTASSSQPTPPQCPHEWKPAAREKKTKSHTSSRRPRLAPGPAACTPPHAASVVISSTTTKARSTPGRQHVIITSYPALQQRRGSYRYGRPEAGMRPDGPRPYEPAPPRGGAAGPPARPPPEPKPPPPPPSDPWPSRSAFVKSHARLVLKKSPAAGQPRRALSAT